MEGLPAAGRPRSGATPTAADSVLVSARSGRAWLALALALLALSALVFVGLVSVRSRQHAVHALASALLQEVGKRTAAELQVVRTQTRPPIEVMRVQLEAILDQGARPPERAGWERWDAELLAVANAYQKKFRQVFVGDHRGNFSILTLQGGSFMIEHNWLERGQTWHELLLVTEPDLSERRTVVTRSVRAYYDPRTRPWYAQAVEQRDFTWTDPYLFVHDPQIGVSAVTPILHRTGRVLGVAGVDIPFGDLSHFLQQMPRGRPGLVFVVSEEGELLAAPGLEHGASKLLRVEQAADPRIRAVAPEVARFGWDGDRPRDLDLVVDGVRWLGVAVPLSTTPWRVVSLVPWDEVMREVDHHNRTFAWALTCGSLACLLLGLRIRRLAEEVRRKRELGSYKLEEKLGSGGMGEVWRGRHRLLARPAAIKIIHPVPQGTAGKDEAALTLRRFVREARATAALDSPHTIRVYDFGIGGNDTFYYVMELLEGFDLERLVERFGPIAPSRAAYLLRQACLSLAEAHAAGLVHRDIKPSNIFACRAGREVDFVKVLDFGLVKQEESKGRPVERLTTAHSIFGTPHYMAPEQALNQPVDGRTDVYSLACVGYWLVTGTCVFSGDSPMQVLLQHTREKPRRPSRLAPAVPPGMDEIILRCLAKEPHLRPDASELAGLLEHCPGLSHPRPEDLRQWWDEHLPAVAVTSGRLPSGGVQP